MKTHDTMTAGCLTLFLDYARDAANWSGTPLVGGNIEHTHRENGYLTALKKAGLLTTFTQGQQAWIEFTAAGQALAAEHDIAL